MIRFMIAFVLFAVTLVNAHEVDKSNIKGLEERLDKVERQQSNLKNETASDKKNLERRVDEIESGAAAGFGLFVSGILCALWAQFTRRSAWLWFFFGLFLAPIALIAMVWKNADGLTSGEIRYWARNR